MAFFSKDNLKFDILGGISAGIVTLPVALAYGVASGLGPMAGMITAIVLGFVSAIFGGTNTQISSPTGAMTVVVALIFATEVKQNGSPEAALPFMIAIFTLTGLFQIIMGLFKVGANIKYIPYSVVSGFLSGIGIIIIVLQIHDLFGVDNAAYKTVPDILLNLDYFLLNIHWSSLIISTATIAIIFFVPKLYTKLPGSLLALVLMTAVVQLFEIPVSKLGQVEMDFAHLDIKNIGQIGQPDTLFRIALAALSLALLGAINTLLTSVVADKMTHTVHDSNKELVGQGLGNFFAGVLGGFPGSGATACTVANIKAGGRNRLSGVVSALFLLVLFLFGMEVAAVIPNAVLGGILVHIGMVLIDVHTLRKMVKISRSDNIVMIIVLVLTVCWNLVFAVLIGLVLASFQFMKRMSDVVEEDTNKTKVDELVNETIDRFNDKLVKAMIQLFGIVADIQGPNPKSRKIVESLIQQRAPDSRFKFYMDYFDNMLADRQKANEKNSSRQKKTSVNSVKVLMLCTQINDDLQREEKLFILTRLIEYVNAEQQASDQEWEFVSLVTEVFGITKEEFSLARHLAAHDAVVDTESNAVVMNLQNFQKYVLIKNIKGPVFFGFSHRFLISMRNISPEVKTVVFNMSFVPFMDHSGVRTFMEVLQFLYSREVQVCFSDLSEENYSLLKGMSLIPDLVPEELVFDSIEKCILWLNQPGSVQWMDNDSEAVYPSPVLLINKDDDANHWKIQRIEKYPKARLEIRNDSGELVFSSVGYNVPWNGYLNDVPLVDGKFEYLIDLNNDGKAIKKGYVYLIN